MQSFSSQKAKAQSFGDEPLRFGEKIIELGLFLAATCAVVVTLGIIAILVTESIPFFEVVSLKTVFTDTVWTPLFADPRYGILPLMCGTLVTTLIALFFAIPVGSLIAIYLSEYANKRLREYVKIFLELLSAIPTVVYGYFALLVVTPVIQRFFPDLPTFNMLSAGIVIGVMILPYVSSLAEDALLAVPGSLREASYALGASKLRTAFQVIYPAGLSGITAAYILGISRAVGETMVVAIAAGMQPSLTINPFEPAETITAYIVQVSMGDLPHGSIGYQTIYVAGLTLFVMTMIFNIIGYYFRTRYQRSI